MKVLMTMLLLFMPLCLMAGDELLPPADLDKPLYQWKGWPPPGNMWLGGRCYKVRVDTETAEELQRLAIEKAKAEMQLKEMQRGGWLMMIGLIVAAAGVGFHFVTAYPMLQRLSEYVLVFGGCLTSAGLFLKKLAQFQNWVFFGLVVVAIAALLYKFRGWSISHLRKKKQAQGAAPATEPGNTEKSRAASDTPELGNTDK